ncbi:M23 family metallopeptidase [Leifsonia sp. Root4]|uniref:M23 family metallopeptidase n=1 Tax=Leifsonia sp. Root4 TaxID=1736525 RepID=UPI000A4D3895|nr:M23 family metallopeptidase [Leifsonia sp. Root4]
MTALWPTGSTTQPRLSDNYGPRSGIEGARSFHYGVDIPMALGTFIHAAQPGTVIFSGRNGTLGVQVVVRTRDGVEFLYPHMEDGSEIALHTVVREGQAVGKVGLTGLTTGPHVCFRTFDGSWRSDADARNPVTFMAALNRSSTAGENITPITIKPEEDDNMKPYIVSDGVAVYLCVAGRKMIHIPNPDQLAAIKEMLAGGELGTLAKVKAVEAIWSQIPV